ncbi:hypothetical protein V3481_004735 [Fusarium oxysporum f. sp. vasinfectum]
MVISAERLSPISSAALGFSLVTRPSPCASSHVLPILVKRQAPPPTITPLRPPKTWRRGSVMRAVFCHSPQDIMSSRRARYNIKLTVLIQPCSSATPEPQLE